MNPTQGSLAQTGMAASALALGCARLGSALTPLGRRECVALVREAYALGVRHFDTASIYGQGDSERYIGEALQAHRAEVCLSSKAGQTLSAKQAVLARFKGPIRWLAARRQGLRQRVAEQRAGGVPRCFDPDAIEASLRASLRRLRTDHLDIFYLHSPDPAVLDSAALMTRIEALRREGLFRAFGVSCDDQVSAWRAAELDAVQVVQFGFDDSEAAHALMRELARRGKAGVLRGLVRPTGGSAGDALEQRFQRTLSLPGLAGIIVGTTNLQHLRENVAAFERANALTEETA